MRHALYSIWCVSLKFWLDRNESFTSCRSLVHVSWPRHVKPHFELTLRCVCVLMQCTFPAYLTSYLLALCMLQFAETSKHSCVSCRSQCTQLAFVTQFCPPIANCTTSLSGDLGSYRGGCLQGCTSHRTPVSPATPKSSVLWRTSTNPLRHLTSLSFCMCFILII
jgi:hypothetical protein